MKKKFAIVFAGVPGVSKSPIATYLSCELDLPIFINDQIRYEVQEDFRIDNINKPGGVDEYQRRADLRFRKLLSQGRAFISDGSVDRKWNESKPMFEEAGYEWFMIHIDLSEAFLRKLFEETGRKKWADEWLAHYLEEHQVFKDKYDADTTLRITDDMFKDRMQLSLDAILRWLKSS